MSRNLSNTNDALPLAGIIGGLAVVLVVIGAVMGTRTIPAGHVGVPVLFGKVQQNTLPEGLHIVNPLLDVEKLSVRSQTYTMSSAAREGARMGDDSIQALSSDGLLIPLDVSIIFRLEGEKAADVYRYFGRDYVENIVRPAARTAVRDAVAQVTSQEAFADKRKELADDMKDYLITMIEEIFQQYPGFEEPGVVVQQVLLRNLTLPDRVKQAIEEKLAASQEAQRMDFVLERERKEADRKKIEAQGIQDFQRIVSQGISDQLLQWKGIEATQNIAESNNSKIIIIGGENGLPLVFNQPVVDGTE